MVALYLALTQNLTLAHGIHASLAGLPSLQAWRLGSSLFVVLFALQVLLLSVAGPSRLLKPTLMAMILLSTVCSYFADGFGVVVSDSMIANVLETDVREAGDLLQWHFLSHLLLQGLLPAMLVWRARVRRSSPGRDLLRSLLLAGGALLLAAACIGAQYKDFSLWGRSNRELRYYNNPAYPLYSAYRYVNGSFGGAPKAPLVIAPDAVRPTAAGSRPLLVVLVVGETARAANFQLNGYARPTNPGLSEVRELLNYPQVTSCGTATAESLPCMFSNLGFSDFTKKKAAGQENILDILARTGVGVNWRDNNSGCKGVCARVATEQIQSDPGSNLCVDGECHDEILVRDLDRYLPQAGQARLLVLHQKGSHGPAYHKRYPRTLRRFTPECVNDNVQVCSREEIINAYDNSIAYTDFVLRLLIDQLRQNESSVDSVLLYVSDHGESLGEHGVYLHGLPYTIAPPEQTRVPMLAWFSARAPEAVGLDLQCARSTSGRAYSHDNLFHSLLGLFNVQTQAYRPELDLYGDCRHRS